MITAVAVLFIVIGVFGLDNVIGWGMVALGCYILHTVGVVF